MLRSWREFTSYLWNLLYDKMVYRELIINLEESEKKKFELTIDRLTEDFIHETQKKKYVLHCCNLCCGGKVDNEKKNDWRKSDGFFCSQLVAAAYVKCGIMPYTLGTGYYLPGHFAHEKDLGLNDNFSLSPEIIIEFSQ
jgi:hypothetical protein